MYMLHIQLEETLVNQVCKYRGASAAHPKKHTAQSSRWSTSTSRYGPGSKRSAPNQLSSGPMTTDVPARRCVLLP
jgi:hypothetical protein